MRLVLCFALVILALCCYEANAKICEAVMRESTIFITKSEKELEEELKKYDAPPEAVQAKLEAKKCVDEHLNFFHKIGVAAILVFPKSSSMEHWFVNISAPGAA
ncbi:secretoglobin family 1D member 4-like [Peromyscus eremicus]|uniref:secretoglobin family 1D member 4-like n=1 Tax=Peromyscus eremicus TaxID=42410 RepID=UPI0027DE8F34|nr:secretoglobin family 1D member 4-like [Peromyscus eremicus]